MDRSFHRLGLSLSLHWFLALGLGVASVLTIASVEAQELCGGVEYPFPYTDVGGVGAAFCPGIMEAYVTGLSKGTTPTTFSPNESVPRLQMTTFLQRSLDQGLMRASRRAALDQWWTAQVIGATELIPLDGTPNYCAADGESIWVTADNMEQFLVQIQASTGAIVNTYSDLLTTGEGKSVGIRIVGDSVFVVRGSSPGKVYAVDRRQGNVAFDTGPALGNQPNAIAFDGSYLWTANRGPPGSVTILTPVFGFVNTVTSGFNAPYGILYDGAHIWVTDTGAGTLLKLDSSGNILQTITVGSLPAFPVFDGANIWVPNYGDDSITVVQASTGNVVATINSDASNQLNGPNGASFDGERILVANYAGNSVSVFKAADLSFIANMATGDATQPISACSDGINFWVPLQTSGNLMRF